MLENILFFVHYALLLLFGILLSFSFADVRLSERNILITSAVFIGVGLLQLSSYAFLGEATVWKIYPLIAHLPAVAVLCLVYRKNLLTATSALSSAYLCCQLPKWVGMLTETLTDSAIAGYAVRIVMLLAVGYVAIVYFSRYVSHIFSKDLRSVLIFGTVPMIYYVFDYSMSVYTDLWHLNNKLAAEFMPFFLCIVYFLFFMVYYEEYEEKAAAVHKEHMITIAVEQQKKEMAAIRRSEHEIRILRHDMRHFLNLLASHLEENDVESSIKLVESLSDRIQAATLQRFCTNDMVNHILSSYVERCDSLKIQIDIDIHLTSLQTDEIIFCSILSNALDNAVNAVKDLPPDRRRINFMLKTSDGRTLLSIKNQFRDRPVIVDGMPVSGKEGHGYGTQSIRWLTERVGGNCQFIVQNEVFILRVVI